MQDFSNCIFTTKIRVMYVFRIIRIYTCLEIHHINIFQSSLQNNAAEFKKTSKLARVYSMQFEHLIRSYRKPIYTCERRTASKLHTYSLLYTSNHSLVTNITPMSWMPRLRMVKEVWPHSEFISYIILSLLQVRLVRPVQ